MDKVDFIPLVEEAAASCLSAHLRQASRTVSQAYDKALRPVGLRSTQFTLLVAVALAGSVTQAALAERLAIDQTTLSRTVGVLARDGLVALQPAQDDGRVQLIVLTRKGRLALEGAIPRWAGAQEKLKTALGKDAEVLLAGLRRTTDAAR